MKTYIATLFLLAALLFRGSALAQSARNRAVSGAPLVLKAVIPLPGASGRMDHMSVELKGKRVFASDVGNGSVYVVDAATDKVVHVLKGFGEPQGNYFYQNRLYVDSGDDGTVKIFDGTHYRLLATAKFTIDADDARFDPKTKTVIVGYSGQKFFDGKPRKGPGGEGDGALGYVKPNGEHGALLPVDAHPEAFEIEKDGARVFVNVPDHHEIEVGNLETHRILARWHVPCTGNFDMALDQSDHRLFTACRKAPTFLVFDTETGKIVESFPIPTIGISDDMYYDAARRRIYVMGAYGYIDVIAQNDANHYTRLARVRERNGGHTALFVPAWNELFVAVSQHVPRRPPMPYGSKRPPVILVFKVQ